MSTVSIYNKLAEAIGNLNGVFGLMGNLMAESGLKSTNLQNTFEKSLGMTDAVYTQRVDSGQYDNFVHDGAGYGLAQWTYWSRKQKLLDYARACKKSIGDEEMQVDFMISELKGYPAVWKVLCSASSIAEASDVVLLQYEKPRNQSMAVINRRRANGEAIKAEIMGGGAQNAQAHEYSRQKVVDLVNSWVGKNEADGSYRTIIDTYNSYSGKLPRGTKMQYGWAWCACTWSALAVALGYTEIMPIEISCSKLIEAAKQKGCWQENDGYVPAPADAVLYDWDDNGVGDNVGSPDHVGTVVSVNKQAGCFVVVEGNYSNAVKKRTVSINGKFIRGFIAPRYTDNKVADAPCIGNKSVDEVAREVIAGIWGTGATRKERLTAVGYNYSEVQARVNAILNGGAAQASGQQSQVQPTEKKVTATTYATKYNEALAKVYKTTAKLYIRNGAGKNNKALALIPEGTEVRCYGYYSMSGAVKWLYIQVALDGVLYTGFSSSEYLR